MSLFAISFAILEESVPIYSGILGSFAIFPFYMCLHVFRYIFHILVQVMRRSTYCIVSPNVLLYNASHHALV